MIYFFSWDVISLHTSEWPQSPHQAAAGAPVLRTPAKGQGDFFRGKHKVHLSLLQGCSPPSHPSSVPVTLLKSWHLHRNVEGQWPSAFPLNWVPLASQDFSAKAKGLAWMVSAGVFQETHSSISSTLSFFFSFFKGTILKCPPPRWGLLTTSEVTARNSPYPLDLVCSFFSPILCYYALSDCSTLPVLPQRSSQQTWPQSDLLGAFWLHHGLAIWPFLPRVRSKSVVSFNK